MQQNYIYFALIVLVGLIGSVLYLVIKQKQKDEADAKGEALPQEFSAKTMASVVEPSGIMYPRVDYGVGLGGIAKNITCTASADYNDPNTSVKCILDKVNELVKTGQTDKVKGDFGDMLSLYFNNADFSKYPECSQKRSGGVYMERDVKDQEACEALCDSRNACAYYTYNGITKECFRWDARTDIARNEFDQIQEGATGCYKKPSQKLIGIGTSWRNDVACAEPVRLAHSFKAVNYFACRDISKQLGYGDLVVFDRRMKAKEQPGMDNCFIYKGTCNYVKDNSNPNQYYLKI